MNHLLSITLGVLFDLLVFILAYELLKNGPKDFRSTPILLKKQSNQRVKNQSINHYDKVSSNSIIMVFNPYVVPCEAWTSWGVFIDAKNSASSGCSECWEE